VHVCNVCKELGREIEGPCAYYLTSYACTLGFSEAIQYTYPNALISLHKPTSHRAWDEVDGHAGSSQLSHKGRLLKYPILQENEVANVRYYLGAH